MAAAETTVIRGRSTINYATTEQDAATDVTWPSASANINHRATRIETSRMDFVNVQIKCSAAVNANDATLTLQGSNDGTNWLAAETALTLNAGSGFSGKIESDNWNWRYARLSYSSGSVSAGTYDISFLARRRGR